MRNGNQQRTRFFFPLQLGSYPTYEEWKLVSKNIFSYKSGLVLILPMRNGNDDSYENINSEIIVLILPMRNGNIYSIRRAYQTTTVLILPMRNGNFFC